MVACERLGRGEDRPDSCTPTRSRLSLLRFTIPTGVLLFFEKKIGVRLPREIVVLLTPRSEPFEIDKDARIALGMKYYGNDELSSGLAARLAGVPREEFWYLMGDYGLSLLTLDEEELVNSRTLRMPTQIVISNNSPLVGLLGLDLLFLLRDLYTEVWIPRKVEKEFLKKDPIVRQEALRKCPLD